MKRRYRYAMNLFSLGLLVFALYLNFVRKDVDDSTPTTHKSSDDKPGAFIIKKSTSILALAPSETLVFK